MDPYKTPDTLPDTSPLYELGASLVHNMNAPVISMKIYIQNIKEIFSSRTREVPRPEDINVDGLLNNCSQLIRQLEESVGVFWESFHVARESQAALLLKRTLASFTLSWNWVMNHLNHSLPSCVTQYSISSPFARELISNVGNCLKSTKNALGRISDISDQFNALYYENNSIKL